MSTISINFTAEQGVVLADHDVDTANIYHIDNDSVGASVPIAAYHLGPIPYVLFLTGTPPQHQSFLKAMFKTTDECPLEFKGYGMHLYQTPATRHTTPPNLVTVTTAM
jgi:hypothetical protein